MKQFILFITFCISYVVTEAQVQPIFGSNYENPVLKKDQLSIRNYPINKRVVLLAGGSQQVCLYVPSPGFDSLVIDTFSCPAPMYSNITYNDRCVTITAKPDAPVSTETVCFDYFRPDTLPAQIQVQIDIVESHKLPFFDDFSTTSVYPDSKLWIDNNVFINNTMAWQPPSIGVATFDGLNSNGTPYGSPYGRADYLTSTYLDLKGAGETYLSFYAQPKGNMYFHEFRDSLVLEFKNSAGDWETAKILPGIPDDKPSAYTPSFDRTIVLLDDKYKYDGFQFRFVNYSYRLGVYSSWHLDYIRVEANRYPGDGINDIALMMPPAKLLKNYTQIPFKQFKGHENELISDTTNIAVWNHYNTKENTESSNIKIKENTTPLTLLDNKVLLEDPQTQRDLTPGPHFFKNYFNPTSLFPAITQLNYSGDPLVIEQEYTINDVQDEIKSNNKVTRNTYIGQIMAYDDGTAEMHVATPAYTSLKTQIAQKFHLNEPDTLQGIQILFPRIYENVSNQLFNLKVWIGSLDKEPDYIYELRRPIYADAIFDTLQGFTSYPLVNAFTQEQTPLAIPKGDFYIGWQQVSVSSTDQYIPVGIDRDFIGGDTLMFFQGDDKWVSFKDLGIPELRGILMIRAAFQPISLTSSNKQINRYATTKIFPNPAHETIQFTVSEPLPEGSTIDIYAASGQLIYSKSFSNMINISNWQSGVYLVNIKNQGKVIWSDKLVKID